MKKTLKGNVIFLVIGFLLINCSAVMKGQSSIDYDYAFVCRQESLATATIAAERLGKENVSIGIGYAMNAYGRLIPHAQAMAKKDGKWQWMKLDRWGDHIIFGAESANWQEIKTWITLDQAVRRWIQPIK